jgi:hypothetical protein
LIALDERPRVVRRPLGRAVALAPTPTGFVLAGRF